MKYKLIRCGKCKTALIVFHDKKEIDTIIKKCRKCNMKNKISKFGENIYANMTDRHLGVIR